ncbi:hypothetical protein J4E06_08510 [Muricauda sp. NFXS6]|uniref:hypothetical protein n=1 Tax=Allomuricauda sp. NFXS6 TaxID=2819094 RepID=UPI0032DEA9C0
MSFSFRNDEFDQLFKKVQNEVKSFIEEKGIELKGELLPENLVMWQMNNAGTYLVHPSDSCPEDLKDSVMEIIIKHNPTI